MGEKDKDKFKEVEINLSDEDKDKLENILKEATSEGVKFIDGEEFFRNHQAYLSGQVVGRRIGMVKGFVIASLLYILLNIIF